MPAEIKLRVYESIAAHRQNKNRDWELAHKSRFLFLASCGERPLVPFFCRSVGTDDRSKLLCTLKPRFGALHTRFDDYTPRNENYRGLIDKI